MIEIIALIFIAKYIGKLAIQKGLKVINWKIYTIACWFIFEFFGVVIGILVLKSVDLFALEFLGLASGFGGFLFIRSILQSKPDINSNEDVNRVGVDDLKP